MNDPVLALVFAMQGKNFLGDGCVASGRSTMQYRALEFKELPRWCFFFDRFPLKMGCGLIRTLSPPHEMKNMKELTKKKIAYVLYDKDLYYFDGNDIQLIRKEVDYKIREKFLLTDEDSIDASEHIINLIKHSYMDPHPVWKHKFGC
jgi:hypothetical protein